MQSALPTQTYSQADAQKWVEAQFATILDPQKAMPHHCSKESLELHCPLREDVLLPGIHTLGVLGGGQLGRYFLMAAKQRGYSTVLWTPEQTPPAKGLSDQVIHAPYDDETALAAFAKTVDAVTVEFEAVPIATMLALESLGARVRPGSRAIAVCQNRALERAFLVANGIAVAPHVVVYHKRELEMAFLTLGEQPCIVKTTRFGYDGKGQRRISSLAELKQAWKDLEGAPEAPLLVEHVIAFKREVSILIARGIDGSRRNYPLVENHHVNGVLNMSFMPAPETQGHTLLEAEDIAKRLAQRWGLTNGKNVIQTEKDLKRIFPEKTWSKLHLQIIYYGREFCKARECYGLTCKICTTCYPNRKNPVKIKKA